MVSLAYAFVWTALLSALGNIMSGDPIEVMTEGRKKRVNVRQVLAVYGLNNASFANKEFISDVKCELDIAAEDREIELLKRKHGTDGMTRMDVFYTRPEKLWYGHSVSRYQLVRSASRFPVHGTPAQIRI